MPGPFDLAVKNDAAVPGDIVLDGQMQALSTEAKNTLGFNEGEYAMFIADQPNVPPSMPPVVMVAQAHSVQQTATQRPHIMGICDLVNLNGSGQADLSPVNRANDYFYIGGKAYPKPYVSKIHYAAAKLSIIQQPKHGRVEPTNSDGDWRYTRYLPNDGYRGNDSVVLQVEGNGHKVKLHYFLRVTSGDGESALDNKACKGLDWKVSSSSPPGTFDLAFWQRNASLSALLVK